MEAILHTASEAVVATDREGRIRFWNPGATRIFGFDAAEAFDRSLGLIIPEKPRERHWLGFHHAVASGRSRYGEGDLLSVPAMTKDGRRVSVEFTITIIGDGGGVVAGMIAIMRDVTKRFEGVKLLQRNFDVFMAASIAASVRSEGAEAETRGPNRAWRGATK